MLLFILGFIIGLNAGLFIIGRLISIPKDK